MNYTEHLEPDQEAMLVVSHLLTSEFELHLLLYEFLQLSVFVYALIILLLHAYQASLKALSGAVSSIDIIYHETLLSSVSSIEHAIFPFSWIVI